MGARYMTFQELLADEREQGRVEGQVKGILTLLCDVGEVSPTLSERILQEKNEETLKKWLRLAAKVETITQFQENM